MALPDLNWRFVGTRAFVGSDLVAGLNASYDLGIATVYADGTPRVPGTGSAWTWAREQSAGTTVAAYGNPPVNALSFRYIIGGTVGVPAPTMLTPDTAAGNLILYGMQRNAGAFTTWTSATPFTNAGFSGYWRGTRMFNAAPSFDSVAMWESQEACVIQFGASSNGNTMTIGFGALIDPLSVNASNAESDGRLYMMFGSGSNAVTSGTWASVANNANASTWGAGSSTASNSHSGVFAPGTAVMYGGAGAQTYRFGTFAQSNPFNSTNGATPLIPVVITTAAGLYLGQSRQWYITEDQPSRRALTLGASTSGWICGSFLGVPTNCVILTP
jgi:hypothetical protein